MRRIFVVTNTSCNKSSRNRDYEPIDPEKFSDWHDILRKVAWIQRGIYNWNKKRKGGEANRAPLSLKEINDAMMYLFKKCQYESYPEEIKHLRQNKPVPINSKIRDLLPFLDENNVMRMDGRIQAATNICEEFKRPIILNRKHKVTKLLLYEFHCRYQHQFQETIVNEVRQKYWIPELRVAVKNVKSNCQLCKNRDAVPVPPQMSKLPLARLDSFRGCFHHCGVDLFGPYQVSVKRSLEKRWGVVYTCLTSRAVYLDVVPDLSSDSMVMSIRNCNSRRGPIKHIYCDQGTNLRGAKTLLMEALDEITVEKIQRECVKSQIECMAL